MSNGWILGLAEKPKVEELQMDWLRSEDLKEEKNVTASVVIIAVEVLLLCVVGAITLIEGLSQKRSHVKTL